MKLNKNRPIQYTEFAADVPIPNIKNTAKMIDLLENLIQYFQILKMKLQNPKTVVMVASTRLIEIKKSLIE